MSSFAPLALLAAAVLVVGCERAPRPARSSVTQSFEELRDDGAARLAARDWDAALRAYQRALAAEPESFEVRYGLAIALSQLDRAEEAAHAFRWVAQHGPADGEPVRVARQWLASTASPATGEPTSARGAAPDGRVLGAVRGRTEWLSLIPDAAVTLRILLEGAESGTRDRRYWAKVRLNEPYEITDVAPGDYRLRAQAGPVHLWDTLVVVERGRPTIVDLTTATAVAPADALRSPSGS